MSEIARATRLAAQLRTIGVDRLLVSSPVDVRYLTGYTGSNGIAVIAAEEHARHLFFTDFRYATQSAEQVPNAYQREIAPAELLQAATQALGEGKQRAGGSCKLGFDDASLSVKQHRRLRELLDEDWELVPCGGVVESLREIKDEPEIARVRAATQLADRALAGVLEAGLLGRSERDVAIELELRMRRLGAQAPSFPSIVAAGEHGALPHAEPRDVEIPPGVLVTIDWGAYLDGYCSDCTRTYATGPLGEDATRAYELVLEAQKAALAAVRSGISGRAVDAVARAVIEDAGHAEHFGHGVGHGVGMEIHEGPRLSRTAGEAPLSVGNVVTVEPGIYLPGRLGVRIEDLVVVTEHGSDCLTGLSKELAIVE
jgi:Xaa-Pro aminopeptidase